MINKIQKGFKEISKIRSHNLKRSLGRVEPLTELYKLRIQLTKIPKEPIEPNPDDCCDTGCIPCILDVYQENLAKWEKYQESIKNKNR